MNVTLFNPENIEIKIEEVCQQIKLKRLTLNYTQEHMAELLKISIKTYRKMEKDCEIANFELVFNILKIIEN